MKTKVTLLAALFALIPFSTLLAADKPAHKGGGDKGAMEDDIFRVPLLGTEIRVGVDWFRTHGETRCREGAERCSSRILVSTASALKMYRP